LAEILALSEIALNDIIDPKNVQKFIDFRNKYEQQLLVTDRYIDITDFIGVNSLNFYIKRTPYFAMQLLSEINRNGLQYLPSTQFIARSNINQATTFFINAGKTLLYIYYTNVKNEPQTYTLYSANLLPLWPLADFVTVSPASLIRLQANKPYSTAGKGNLYDINLCYTTTPHDFELRELEVPEPNVPSGCSALITGENRCLTAPANSMGYFIVPIAPGFDPRLEAASKPAYYTIFPNPSNTSFNIISNQTIEDVKIFNLDGILKLELNKPGTNNINIETLPQGVYLILINNTTVLKLIKA